MPKTVMPENKPPIGRRKFLKSASLAGAAMLSARVAKVEEPTPTTAPMPGSGDRRRAGLLARCSHWPLGEPR